MVVALKMMESGCDLNQPLQKRLFRLGSGKPHQFPVFMRLKEGPGIEAAPPCE